MALARRTIEAELTERLAVEYLGRMARADNIGTEVVVSVTYSGVPFDMAGNGIAAYFMRPGTETVVTAGTVDGSSVTVMIPEAALAVPGRVAMAVRAIAGERKTTIALAEFDCVAVSGDTLIDPGHVVPNIDNLLAQIQRMEAAAAAAETVVHTFDTKYADIKGQISSERTRAVGEEQRIEALFTAPTQEAVDTWLDAHPEATTTVQDGAVTEQKINPELLQTIKNVTPEAFGAVGDGVTDDTAAVQAWVNAHVDPVYSGNVFGIGNKTYALSQSIKITTPTFEEIDFRIDFGGAHFVAMTAMDEMLRVQTVASATDFGTDASDKFRIISGGHWDGRNLAKRIISYGSRQIRIEKMHLLNAAEVYLHVWRGNVIFTDSYLDRRDYSITHSTGLFFDSTSSDSKVLNIRARDISKFTQVAGDSIYFINCHAWLVRVLTNTVFCEYSAGAYFIGCYPDTYNTVVRAFNGKYVFFTTGTLFWNTGLLPADYPQPVLLEHGEGYTDNINVFFQGMNFDLYSLVQFGKRLKYCDTVPNMIGRTQDILNNNNINPTRVDNLPIMAGYRNSDAFTIRPRNAENSVRISSVRHIGNGLFYLECWFQFATQQIIVANDNYGICTMDMAGFTLSQFATMHGHAYHSDTPNKRHAVAVDLTQNTETGMGYVHVFAPEDINEITDIRFSGVFKLNMGQGF